MVVKHDLSSRSGTAALIDAGGEQDHLNGIIKIFVRKGRRPFRNWFSRIKNVLSFYVEQTFWTKIPKKNKIEGLSWFLSIDDAQIFLPTHCCWLKMNFPSLDLSKLLFIKQFYSRARFFVGILPVTIAERNQRVPCSMLRMITLFDGISKSLNNTKLGNSNKSTIWEITVS